MAEFKLNRIRFTWKGNWAATTVYIKDDIIRYEGKSYVCLVGHTASADFYDDLYYINTATDPDTNAPKWTLWLDGYAWRNQWLPETFYSEGDIVSYSGIVYICNESHTSADEFINVPVTNITGDGTEATVTFDTQTPQPFEINQHVTITGVIPSSYNGVHVVTSASSTSITFDSLVTAGYTSGGVISHTTDLGLEADEEKWTSYARHDNWLNEWATETKYRVNDIVKYNGIIYRCTEPHTSVLTNELGLEANLNVEVEPLIFLDYWEVLSTSENWSNVWTTNTRYRKLDTVRYGGKVYTCVTGHTSAATIALGLENNTSDWEEVFNGVEFKGDWAESIRYKLNDIVKYGGGIYICSTYHTSTYPFDETKWDSYIPGFEYDAIWDEEVLYQPGDVVKHGGYGYYSVSHNIGSAPSLSSTDWNLLTVGFRVRGEWDDETQYYTGDTIKHFGRVYTAISDSLGDVPPDALIWELVIPGIYWKNFWAVGTDYVLDDVVTYLATSYRCIEPHTATLINNPLADTLNEYWITLIEGDTGNRLETQGDVLTYDSNSTAKLPIGNEGEMLVSTSTLGEWKEFGPVVKLVYVSMDGVDAAGYGNTLETPYRTVKYACENTVGPATISIKTGIYREILPISIPANIALVGDELRSTVIAPADGYETEDMFYVRNGTGIRNMTLRGLSGTLGELNQYETRRPSAGAYVSLDPGDNPSDASVWITSRSPYVQNVTTFGTGCIGLKVDGDLHDGGNKSIVANDFTQVLSDGIGAWVTNLGRAELVSVFSYYGYMGYLAENGGKIRATNGNSSYGTYGCVSEGFDTTETPVSGSVNNRAGEAIVGSVFAGQASDEILILEYSNAGQNYTSASFNFVGAGTGVDAVALTFRDNAIYEARIMQMTENASAGGSSYLFVSNNAQSGTDTGIRIATNDENTAENYLTMRLIIASGTGVGQYGFIGGYDEITKDVVVCKESFASLQISSTSGELITTSSTATLTADMPIVFTGTALTSTELTLGSVYYVLSDGFTSSQFKVSTSVGGLPVTVDTSTGGGPMYVAAVGWDHVVAGEPIELILDTTTRYNIEPRVTFSAPAQVGGIRAQGRAIIVSNRISEVRLWDCGSGYTSGAVLTLTDPNNSDDAIFNCRIGNGVLGPATFNNRGTGYQTSTTTCTVSGDGFADSFQLGKFVTVNNLSRIPGPGANLIFSSIPDTIYKVVTVQELTSTTAIFRVSPELDRYESPVHNTSISVRENYSQVRLTGHDFLDIGVGNFVQTNYPNINEFNKAPENEVLEKGGGRVFYTSTDQDGNFRCGELFKVEQSTGIVTISADFFQLTGLEELSLGGVSIGGSAVVVREFSTDVNFTADSNNVIPTQRAIKAYIAKRISGGGADAQTGRLISGIVGIGPQRIDTTTQETVVVDTKVNIKKGIDGSMLAMTFFTDNQGFTSD